MVMDPELLVIGMNVYLAVYKKTQQNHNQTPRILTCIRNALCLLSSCSCFKSNPLQVKV